MDWISQQSESEWKEVVCDSLMAPHDKALIPIFNNKHTAWLSSTSNIMGKIVQVESNAITALGRMDENPQLLHIKKIQWVKDLKKM